jgi:LPXTG-motif cell wall-anchored protein
MPPIRRRLRAAAFILLGLAAAGAPALAQNETSNTIGPPQLKDFSLPGQRTTPPATPAPVPVARPPAAEPQTPAATAAPAATRERPVEPRPRPAPPAARDVSGPAAAAPVPGPSAAEPAPQPATPPPAQAEPVPLPDPEAAAPAPVSAGRGTPWLWPAVGGALLLAAAALFLLRRRRASAERENARESAREEIGGALVAEPEPEPAPAPAPAPAADAPAPPRPWLELDIAPERAAATENEVYVRYALTLTNRGEAGARNIRIDPRLFNAGAEGEMAAFFQGPIHEESGSPHVLLPPGGSLKLNGQVAMPNSELREIEMAGRRIFVPMVAINVAYDWADGGSGRTSRSWLVGREAEVPSEKMGPFRLDLGPRIYRSVGRREARLVMV